MKKTVLITGASGNLGSATVQIMLNQQYRVVASGNKAGKPAFMEQLENIEYHQVNLSMEEDASNFVAAAIERYGAIDAGLLLAGGFDMGTLGSSDQKALKRMFEINFETAYNTARPLFSHMMKQGYGRIVFVGARAAHLAAQGKHMIGYALSKSLLFRLSEYLNEEAKGFNVVSSVIVPSTIDTPQNRESMPDADTNKWVKPEEIAELLGFICSDKAAALREPVYKIYNNS